MDEKVIGRYKFGDDEIVLTVPQDAVGQEKLKGAEAAMDAAETSEMGLKYFAVLISVLSGRSVEECYTMIPLGTVALMHQDIQTWLACLVKVRPC